MTELEKQQIAALQYKGFGYRKIAALLQLPDSKVKYYCRTNPLPPSTSTCQMCEKPIWQIPHKKAKRFCSDACRMAWWRQHQDQIKHKKLYAHNCQWCRKQFESHKTTTKFCSRKCYAEARKKDNDDGSRV